MGWGFNPGLVHQGKQWHPLFLYPVGHENFPLALLSGYSISQALTGTAGQLLVDASQGYVSAAQAALMSSVLSLQRKNLYAGNPSIVSVRTQVSAQLRQLMALPNATTAASIRSQVVCPLQGP